MQRPCWRVIDVVLRDTEARHNANSTTNIIQQPHVRRKVQHAGLTVLAATKNYVQFPLPSLAAPKRSVNGSRMQLFGPTNSLASSETAPASYISIPRWENTRISRPLTIQELAHTLSRYRWHGHMPTLLSPNPAYSSFALHI